MKNIIATLSLMFCFSIPLVQAEEKTQDEVTALKHQLTDLKQELSLVSGQLRNLENKLTNQVSNMQSQQNNKIDKVKQERDYFYLRVNWFVALITFCVGVVATLIWKTKDIGEIVTKEVEVQRKKITEETIKEIQPKLEEDLKDWTEGLEYSIQQSVKLIKHKEQSEVLIVTNDNEPKGSHLDKSLISLGFKASNITLQEYSQVFPEGQSTPSDADKNYALVVLDTLEEDKVLPYVKNGMQPVYLLYYTEYYKVAPDRQRTLIANSKPALYGHVMNILAFNEAYK